MAQNKYNHYVIKATLQYTTQNNNILHAEILCFKLTCSLINASYKVQKFI